MRPSRIPLRLILLALLVSPIRLAALELRADIRLSPCQELQFARDAQELARKKSKAERRPAGVPGQCISVDNSGHPGSEDTPMGINVPVHGSGGFSSDGTGHFLAQWDSTPLLFALFSSPLTLPGFQGYYVDADPLVVQPMADLTLTPDPESPGQGAISGRVHLAARLVLESDYGSPPVEDSFPLDFRIDGRYVVEMSPASQPAMLNAHVVASGPCDLSPGLDCLILIELSPPSGTITPKLSRCYCEDCSKPATCIDPESH